MRHSRSLLTIGLILAVIGGAIAYKGLSFSYSNSSGLGGATGAISSTAFLGGLAAILGIALLVIGLIRVTRNS
jgi:hypothetical protein